jgi:glycosyltransferase involved in cell wall biosynthesis
MNYLKLSNRDFLGAGEAAVRRVDYLNSIGVNAKLVVFEKRSNNSNVIGLFDSNVKWEHFLVRLIRRLIFIYKGKKLRVINKKFCMYDMQLNFVSARKILKLYGAKPDVVDVAWVTDFVSTKTIKKLQELTGAKVLYVMADNAPITGGCHYPWDCKGFTKNCFPCPALNRDDHRAERTLSFKQKYITSDMIIAGTTNDTNRAKISVLFKNSIIIPSVTLGKSPYLFSRQEGRIKWGIMDDKFVVFCGANNISEERKGFKELVNALEFIRNNVDKVSSITVLVAGKGAINFPEGYDVIMTGDLNMEDLFKAYYCADLFVCPSLEDSGPMMINYAFMTNLPVVCFPMGVALDLILHEKNGYIAEWASYQDLGKGILFWLNQKDITRNEIKIINDEITKEIKINKQKLNRLLGLHEG